jgi:hypothetical protein
MRAPLVARSGRLAAVAGLSLAAQVRDPDFEVLSERD